MTNETGPVPVRSSTPQSGRALDGNVQLGFRQGDSKVFARVVKSLWLLTDIALTFGHQIYSPMLQSGVANQGALVSDKQWHPLEPGSLMEAPKLPAFSPCRRVVMGHDAFQTFLVEHLGALRRFFDVITTACSTGCFALSGQGQQLCFSKEMLEILAAPFPALHFGRTHSRLSGSLIPHTCLGSDVLTPVYEPVSGTSSHLEARSKPIAIRRRQNDQGPQASGK